MKHMKSLTSFYERNPWAQDLCVRMLPQISESYIAVEKVALYLLLCGVASGFLGGLIGTGSPAQLIAFSSLNLTKGSMRGVKVQATVVSNVIRLAVIASSKTNVFNLDDWPVYLAVCVMSLAGATFGTWIRTFIDKDALLIGLFWLLWFTSADLIGVFHFATSIGAIVFYAGTVVLFSFNILCFYRPRLVGGATEYLQNALCCNALDNGDTFETITARPSKSLRSSTASANLRMSSTSGHGSLHGNKQGSTRSKSFVRDVDTWES